MCTCFTLSLNFNTRCRKSRIAEFMSTPLYCIQFLMLVFFGDSNAICKNKRNTTQPNTAQYAKFWRWQRNCPPLRVRGQFSLFGITAARNFSFATKNENCPRTRLGGQFRCHRQKLCVLCCVVCSSRATQTTDKQRQKLLTQSCKKLTHAQHYILLNSMGPDVLHMFQYFL